MRTIWPLSLVVWVALGTTLVSALVTVVGALFPGAVARTRKAAEAWPARAFAVGLVNGAFLVAVGLALRVLARQADLRVWLVTMPVLVVLGAGLALGCAGVAGVVGGRIWPDRPEPLQRAFGGGLATLGSLVPVVGWLVLLPYILALGLGAVVLAAFHRPAAPHAQSALAPAYPDDPSVSGAERLARGDDVDERRP